MNITNKLLAGLLACLAAALLLSSPVCAENAANGLLNGSFELDASGNAASLGSTYEQRHESLIQAWETTSTDSKIELFKQNTGTYITNVHLTPTDGSIAAELNADQESTLYQVVQTKPMSLYEWGLDHGGRTASDTMALIIGPNQAEKPGKPGDDKANRDQFMQMVDWLKEKGILSSPFTPGIANNGAPIILYSMEFDAGGGFKDGGSSEHFSLTPSAAYSQMWYVWIMTDIYSTYDVKTKVYQWSSYGKNRSDYQTLSKAERDKYLYTVPEGQTETIFAFVSVETIANESQKDVSTYGNFLDNVSFSLYHPLAVSSTPFGSAAVMEVHEAPGETPDDDPIVTVTPIGHRVTLEAPLHTYVADRTALRIQARIPKDGIDTTSFAGVNDTVPGSSVFIANKAGAWAKTTDPDTGDILYTYSGLPNVTSAVSLHFIFIKSPVISYDANGGKPYVCTGTLPYYDFMPRKENGKLAFVDPYTSHAAEGYDGWRFTAWQMTDGSGARMLLPGVHRIACNYHISAGDQQRFVILNEAGSFTKGVQADDHAVWTASGTRLYEQNTSGLAMVAQWKWRQRFVPMTWIAGPDYEPSDVGGTVSVTEAGETESGANGVKDYYADEGEMMSATAIPRADCTFDGWYDESGSLVTLSRTLNYRENKEQVSTYYARFTKRYRQTYLRQILLPDGWVTLKDDDATLPGLSPVSRVELYGTPVFSTAADNASYALTGWFDADGAAVPASMLTDGGKTLRYAVTEDATYFARFMPPDTLELRYDANAPAGTTARGSVASQGGKAGAPVTLRTNGFVVDGCDFTGWNTLPDGSGTAYAEGDAFTLSPDVSVLYAQWKPIEPPVSPEDVNLPDTGDTAQLHLWLWLLSASVLAGIVLILVRKRSGRNKR